MREDAILLAVWDVAHAVACPRHGRVLAASCECGRPLADNRRGIEARSCPCGRSYAAIGTEPAGDIAVRGSGWIVAALESVPMDDPRRAPPPFGTLRLGDLVIAMELIGRAATTDPRDDPVVTKTYCNFDAGGLGWDVPVSRSIEIVEAAVPIMEDWPASWLKLQTRFAERNLEGRAAPHRFRTRGLASRVFSTRMGTSLVRPWRGIDGRPIDCLVAAADLWARNNLQAPLKTIWPASKRAARRPGVFQRACARTGDDPARQGTRVRFNEAVATLPPDLSDPQKVEDRIVKAMATITTGPALHLLDRSGRARIEHWIHPDLLSPLSGRKGPRGEPLFARETVSGLRDRFTRVVSRAPPDGIPPGFVPVDQGSRRCTARWYPKTRLILDVLTGTVPAVATDEDATFSQWRIDAGAAIRASLSARVRWLWEGDGSYPRHRLHRLLAELWPGCTPVAMDRDAIRRGEVDGHLIQVKCGDRIKPEFRISVRSALCLQRAVSGPSPACELDHLISDDASKTGPPLARRRVEASMDDPVNR